MRFIHFMFGFFTILVCLDLNAEQLPPLGRRIYILDQKNPSQPAVIRSMPAGSFGPSQALMKDPLLVGGPSKSKLLNTVAQPVAPKRISRMVFDRSAVQGRYLVPRVRFDRPTLGIGRSEEAIKVEYRQKLRESEKELRDFEW